VQVLNLAPWGNVLLQLPPLRTHGAHGWAALGAAVGEHYLKDITTNQVRLSSPELRTINGLQATRKPYTIHITLV